MKLYEFAVLIDNGDIPCERDCAVKWYEELDEEDEANYGVPAVKNFVELDLVLDNPTLYGHVMNMNVQLVHFGSDSGAVAQINVG